MAKEYDFEIDGLDENTIAITTAEKFTKKILDDFRATYSESGNKTSGTNLNYDTGKKNVILTQDIIDGLAFNAQNSMVKIQEINNYIDYYLNKEGLIGQAYEAIEQNVNGEFKLTYPIKDGRNKKIKVQEGKDIIDKFNKNIGLKKLIKTSIPYAYANGNKILYLKKNNKGNYKVDEYPLGIVEITNRIRNGEPVLKMNLNNLISRLSVEDTRYTLTGNLGLNEDFDKSRVTDDILVDIKQNFPKEAYEAIIEKDRRKNYVLLDHNSTGTIRVNNRGKLYGLSPVFKSLGSVIKLEGQENSDTASSKARAKKIIVQYMSDKFINEEKTVPDLTLTKFAHDQLLKAWKNEVVLLTAIPGVTKIEYVEPKNDIEHTNTLSYYRNRVMSILGITYKSGDSKTGVASAQLSLDGLMTTIDNIAEQFEDIINKWYKKIYDENGLNSDDAPTIEIFDSSMMETKMKITLADTLFSKFGVSFKTIYEIMNIDMDQEVERRKGENEADLDKEVFYPRANAFNSSGDEDPPEKDKKDIGNEPDSQKNKTNETT